MRPWTTPFTLVLGLLAAGGATAQERFTPTVGGHGGSQYRLHCPAGTALTGVTGLAGAWVVRLGPECDGRSRSGSAGGSGGAPKSASCPEGSVVSTIAVRTLRSDNHYVDSLLLECVARSRRNVVTARVPYDTPQGERHGSPAADIAKLALTGPIALLPGQSHAWTGTLSCAPQEIVGLQGQAGASLDSIGLICGRATRRR